MWNCASICMNYWNVGIVTTLKGIMWHYIVVPFSHFWIGILNSYNNSLVSFNRRSHNITGCYRVLTCLFPLLFSGMRDLAYLTRCRVWITPHWHVKRKAHGLSGLLKWISSTLVVLCRCQPTLNACIDVYSPKQWPGPHEMWRTPTA